MSQIIFWYNEVNIFAIYCHEYNYYSVVLAKSDNFTHNQVIFFYNVF